MPRPGTPLGGRSLLRRLAGLSLAALAGSACEREVPAVSQEPPRVVSLSESASRFALALGAGPLLVGVDAASAGLPGLDAVPRTDLAGAGALAPDLVLVGPTSDDPGAEDAMALRALAARGVRVASFAPHDLEDVLALVRDVGERMVGAEGALQFERSLSRPLAAIAGESGNRPRPRVAAVVSFDPLVIAGGHSFETDLIEIAGGHSVTHPGPEPRVPIRADDWHDLDLDLILVVAAEDPPPRREQAMRNALPPDTPVAFYRLEQDFWLDTPEAAARRLRATIEPVSRGMEAP